MGNISLGLIGCILALLCTVISPTPLEKRRAGHISQAPRFEPRDIVTVERFAGLTSVVQSNAPYYDTACQVGGCTFSYEASGTVCITFAAHLTSAVGGSFLLAQCVTECGLPCHTRQPSDCNPSRWIADVYYPFFDDDEPSIEQLPQAISQRLRHLHLVLSLRRMWNQTPRSRFRRNDILRTG